MFVLIFLEGGRNPRHKQLKQVSINLEIINLEDKSVSNTIKLLNI
jgi:hypothetical protein